MAEMTFDNFIDEQLAFDLYTNYGPRVVTREERKESWQRSIIENEKYGAWQLGGKNPKKILFADMTFDHMVNVYEMLKRNDMYIPAFIMMTVENPDKGALDKMITSKRLETLTVLALERGTTCKTCPLAYYNFSEDDEGCYGDGHYHCKITDEDVNYQYKYKRRGVICPLKDVI